MYIRAMLVALLANGFGAFGLRVLSAMGLAGIYQFLYLSFWYLSGGVLAAGAFLLSRRRSCRREAVIGSAMAMCSVAGQAGMALALARDVPGFVVFPVATGGGLLLVAATGAVAFRERPSGYGYFGLALGSLALLLLALP